jgi:hypothetical protein
LPHQKSAIRHLKSIFYLLLLPCALSLAPCASDAIAASVTLGWDSNTEPDLEGYVIYRNVGSPGPPYDYSDTLPEDDLANPLQPKATLTGLQEGKEYYIALTAYNTDGVESSFSNDVCVEVVNGAVEACTASYTSSASTASSSGGNSSGGGGSSSCFISTSSPEPSIFSKFVAGPAARSRVMAITILLMILTAAIRSKAKKLLANCFS